MVVTPKLDRMFRSTADCLAVVEAFKARGVSLFLLDLNGGADDVSGNGIARLFLTIVSAFAEFERDRIGERIRATKRAQRARGEYLGGPPRPVQVARTCLIAFSRSAAKLQSPSTLAPDCCACCSSPEKSAESSAPHPSTQFIA
jgi:DNA invertase Pin-like site-specific DNA recombinase